jgi:hypothetical protein
MDERRTISGGRMRSSERGGGSDDALLLVCAPLSPSHDCLSSVDRHVWLALALNVPRFLLRLALVPPSCTPRVSPS